MQALNVGPIVVINPSLSDTVDFAIAVPPRPVAVVNASSDTRSAEATALRSRMTSYGVTPRRVIGASTAIVGIVGLGASTITAATTFLAFPRNNRDHSDSSDNIYKFSAAIYGAIVSLVAVGTGIAAAVMPAPTPFQPPLPETITPVQSAPMYGIVVHPDTEIVMEISPQTIP